VSSSFSHKAQRGLTAKCHLINLKPRELTWVTGVVLAVLTASFGVIGYWAVKIVTGVPEAIPVIGLPLVELLRGSASVGQSTLTRFYSLHTFVLPLLTAVFMLMHFLMILKQGILSSQPMLYCKPENKHSWGFPCYCK
ncbi:Cytochrome b6, partial [Bienertia sinuspersici]